MVQRLKAFATTYASSDGLWVEAMGPTTPDAKALEQRAQDYIRSSETTRRAFDDHDAVAIRSVSSWTGLVGAFGLRGATKSALPGSKIADIAATVKFAMEKAVTDERATALERLLLLP